MDNPIANRSDDRYSPDMHKVEPLQVVTTMFPAYWLHNDDDTLCTSPEQCSRMGRDSHVRGGSPDQGQWAEREGWS